MSATERFAALVQGPEDGLGLDVACLLIAAHRSPSAHPDHPSADPLAATVLDTGMARLDELAAGCGGRGLDDVLDHLFGAHGFTGNRGNYEDPANSMLDLVLDRRTGIPITLSIVLIEVARRVGLRLDGVGMPGHFLVGTGDGRYVDSFEGGRVLDVDACRDRFRAIAGAGAQWSPSLLDPVGPRAIVGRVLANLRRIYAESQDLNALSWVLQLRVAIPGISPRERAERASVLSALGQYGEAANELDRLSGMDAEAREALRSQAARLRARLN
jgi:regulator of sirC expression with transglutaminase-like and TPR domain